MTRIQVLNVGRREWSRRAGGVAALLVAVGLAAVGGTPALAVSPPSVVTGAAKQVQFASAVVTGTVNPGGIATTYFFEYGPTVVYGRQTSSAPAGSGIAAAPVSQSVSGLAALTTYHYRLVAVSAAGTVDGKDATFTTPRSPAPAVTTGAASAVSETSAVVTGTVNPEGVAASYFFQYGTTAAYGRQTPSAAAGSGTGVVSVRMPLSGLVSGSTFHFRLVAVSTGGTVDGRDATFTTSKPVPPKKPTAPLAVTGPATSLTPRSAVLTGTVNPEGAATSFFFEYGTKSPTVRTPTVSAGSGIGAVPVSASLSGLAPGGRYVYRLVAVGAGTATSSTRSFTTPKIPLGITLTSRPNPVAAGAAVTFGGNVSGTGVGVRSVALQVKRYPYTSGFQQVGNAEVTNGSGGFTFSVAITANTMVRAVTVSGSPSLVSPTVFEKAAVRVSVHVRRHGRSAQFFGLVAPTGAPVQIRIQRRVRSHWVTIARTPTSQTAGGQEAYSRTIRRHRPGRYRVIAHVLDGSLLSSLSRALTLH